MAFDNKLCYYKHLSEFTFKYESEFDSREPQKFNLRKITEVSMNSVGCAEQEDGVITLKALLENPAVLPFNERYDGFRIIRIGEPKCIWLPDETSLQFMRDDLSTKPIMAYWDERSIAFIISDECVWDSHLFGEFLAEARHITYVKHTGILVK